MPSQLSRWIAMASVKARGKTAEVVRERVLAGQCLIEGCPNEPTRRGLCTNHYQQFRNTLASKGDKAVAFEEELIRKGLILPVGEVREIRQPNPFEA